MGSIDKNELAFSVYIGERFCKILTRRGDRGRAADLRLSSETQLPHGRIRRIAKLELVPLLLVKRGPTILIPFHSFVSGNRFWLVRVRWRRHPASLNDSR